MKKKFFVLLMVLAAILTIACRKNPDPLDPRYDVTYGYHSEKGIGSYFVHRCNPIMGYCEDEAGTVRALSIFNGSIGTELLHQSGSYIILNAAPGYEWVFKDSTLFRDSGFFFQKTN